MKKVNIAFIIIFLCVLFVSCEFNSQEYHNQRKMLKNLGVEMSKVTINVKPTERKYSMIFESKTEAKLFFDLQKKMKRKVYRGSVFDVKSGMKVLIYINF